MNRLTRILAIAASLSPLLGSVALADTAVTGEVEIDVETGEIVSIADGANTLAATNIGSILEGTHVRDDVVINVKTGDVTTGADRPGQRKCTNIGTLARDLRCR